MSFKLLFYRWPMKESEALLPPDFKWDHTLIFNAETMFISAQTHEKFLSEPGDIEENALETSMEVSELVII